MSDVSLERKLTDEEGTELRSKLLGQLNDGDEADIKDLLDYTMAMLNNLKSISYIVDELTGMEMDVCDEAASKRVGSTLEEYIQSLNKPNASDPATPNIKSLKSGGGGNALTMAGALGSSRERTNKSDGNKNNTSKNQEKGKQNNPGGNNKNVRKAAFDRLSKGRGNKGRGRDDRRSGRGGHNDGRDERRNGRGGTRGGGRRNREREPRGGRRGNEQHLGKRRERDEDDFIPAERREAGRAERRGRGGRGGRADGGGRWSDRQGGGRGRRGGGDGRWNDQGRPKYQRVNEASEEQNEDYNDGFNDNFQNNDDGYYSYGFRGRGYRGGRGRGRGPHGGRGGRGRGEEAAAAEQETQGEGGPAAHPSPLVAANYRGGGRSSFRGGRYGGGRGFYRAQVQSMIASKTWVRKKDDGETPKNDDGNAPAEG